MSMTVDLRIPTARTSPEDYALSDTTLLAQRVESLLAMVGRLQGLTPEVARQCFLSRTEQDILQRYQHAL